MGGDDDRLHGGNALFENFTLNDGEFFVRALHSEIAARDHDGVGGGDNAEDILNGGLVFDLGNDADLLGVVLGKEIA